MRIQTFLKNIYKLKEGVVLLGIISVVLYFLLPYIDLINISYPKFISSLNTTLLLIFLAVMIIVTGVDVLKSFLYLVVGLTVVGQSYCGVLVHLVHRSDVVVWFLMFVVFLISINFLRTLYKSLVIHLSEYDDSSLWSWKRGVTSLVFLLFTGLLFWDIYIVISPMLLGVCK